MIYHIYANQSNVGDWLSALGIQSLLAPHQVQELFCDEPFVEQTLSTLSGAGPEDFIIIGGGGLLMDYFIPFWEAFRPVASRVPFCIWGVGCCDMKQEPSRPPQKLISEIVRQSQLCTVRDELTREFLTDCRLPAPVPCPMLLKVTACSGQQRRLLHVDHYNNVGPAIYEKMVGMAQQYAAATDLAYRQTNNRIERGRRPALNAVLDLYASANLVLTSRLHGCIMALATGRPVLAVSGDYKIDWFMRAAGLSQWVCGLDEVESLPERLAALPTQQIPTAFLDRARQQNREIAQRVRLLLPKGQPALAC